MLRSEPSKIHDIHYYLRLFKVDDVVPVALQAAAKLIKLRKSQFLIMQDSRPSGVYLLVNGTLQVSQYDKNGGNVIFTVQEALSVLGDLEIFCHDCRDNTFSSVQAIQTSTVILLPEQALLSFGLNDVRFLRFMCQHLAKKIYESSLNKVAMMMTASEKLHRYLHIQSLVHGNCFQLMKRESLASLLGISVRQLTRALDELNKAGFISHKNKTVKIHHVPDNL